MTREEESDGKMGSAALRKPSRWCRGSPKLDRPVGSVVPETGAINQLSREPIVNNTTCSRDSSGGFQPKFSNNQPGLEVVVVVLVEVAVVQETKPIGEAERASDRRNKRRQSVGADHH